MFVNKYHDYYYYFFNVKMFSVHNMRSQHILENIHKIILLQILLHHWCISINTIIRGVAIK